MNFGRYEIIEEIGKGSMGVVYKAHDPQIDRIVALKVLRQDRMSSDDFVQRFTKEAKAVGRLSHPNIVTVYDVGQDNDTIYIAMEFLEGTSLGDIINKGLMNCAQVVKLGIQVAEALHYASQKGITHRDIKPSNIIVGPEGQAKLTDFGIARIESPLDQHQTQIGEILGTPAYMSPEQVKGQDVDKRTDLFSLGIILYELSTGRRPFVGSSMMATFREIMEADPVAPATVNPAMSTALSVVIMKSLRKKPEERFQNGKEMAEALGNSLGQKQEGPEPVSPTPQPGPLVPPATLYSGVALIVLALIVGGFYLFSADKEVAPRAPGKIPAGQGETTPAIVRQVSLIIETVPPGAQVFINGSFRGMTPSVQKLPLGKHEVRLNLEGFHSWEAQLQLDQEGEEVISVELLAADK